MENNSSSVNCTPCSTTMLQQLPLNGNGRAISSQGSPSPETPVGEGESGETQGPPRLIVDFSDFTVPVPSCPRSLQPEEIRRHFLVSLEKMFALEPESMPFRQPVDPEELGIPDYCDIIRKPMDLQTIRIRMNCQRYLDPWMYVDDVLLMFDNAWVYNRPNSMVYRYCSKLAEVFQQEVNPVMFRIGYKHGRIHQFNSETLSCFGRPVCLIGKNETYYNFLRFHLCQKCYTDNLDGDGVKLSWHNNVSVNKENFLQLVNNSANCYSPAAEMHRSHLRDAEMSRQLVIREFLRILCCPKTRQEKKRNILKMLKLNLQLRSEFMKHFHQQEILLSTPELTELTTQLEYLELNDEDIESTKSHVEHDELVGSSEGESGTTPIPPSDEIPRSATPTSLNDTSPSSSNYSTLSSTH